jgi:hypothetical protein
MPGLQSFDAALTAFSLSSVFAYLDPGTGSMIFQILVAGFLSASFFLRSWARLLRYVLWMKISK